ncbi:MAG: EAL domain-containing protein [Arcobacter sp.]|jgi:diguanylate cyclase (GGDEF)-like protein|uniref:Response regulator receiver-modulated diguanylate cyclase/phosphodiesterase n=1 Tax=Arcobacter defluvii TaxID=873191 RepID=A0AAE7BFF8_9BACT|nr:MULTISPECIES: EAL domain-containing protein [Arcobacter]MDY3200490.1 EAL domain-containing protein [Arcobacter sp.]QKF76727.1 response regulator receiver-modulated diguanylate cyclase/phosphodiesterase [Arcobacter defluvii]RXI34869.1 GGDEF domain-containing response regulator [Arcobacter defluvii]BAK72539.1 diguanylate cyclase/phosphodiesterase [Arcobacter sp. L]
MINNISILKNITILYAEDEKDLREVTHQILKGFTKKQYVAQNGQEGLELFKKYENEIDLIITDVNMPILNGLDMVKEIKKINMNIPIIVATAFSNKEYLLEAIDIGVDKYVLKPIDIAKLLQVMSQSLIYHELKDLYTDKLTNLPNRNKLKKDLDENNIDLMALLDIDEFSTVNDLFGEKIGDTILYELANKLKSYFSDEEYFVYRIEADKFAIVAKQSNKDVNEFYDICKTFADKIEKESLLIDEDEIDINITIGIAQGDGARAYKYSQRVINYARTKLQRIMIYNESFKIQQSFEENIKWVKQLKVGFRENLFQAYFQPIVDTQTKEVHKYEALIRYVTKEGVEIAPYNFINVAKKTKLYPNIIKIVIQDAFKLIKNKNKRVSVNISFDDIANEETTAFIYEVLEQNRKYTQFLEFEILESEEISDFNEVSKFIAEIKKFDCIVGVDDFGAGYSNFNLLTLLDIDFVKIDGSLIERINSSKDLEIIVNTIANFSKEFKVKTVAEYVSNEDIYNKIKELNIDYCQGYYFEKPLSYDSIN